MSQPSSPAPEQGPATPAVDPYKTASPGASAAALPAQLGRYRILAPLGAGGFGIVYKGRDDELRRDVAIKVPHRERLARLEDAAAYLAEGRILATLDHPGIVPVYDFGRTDDGLCYLVSKFVEGRDLTHLLRESRPAPAEAAEMVACAAEALHHAHQRGLIHRDVKPANILLDRAGQPIVTDFGLALSEEDFGKGARYAGTPAYMSPEQARGEGHRVDARSDVYSLGVVLYEMFTGRPPFGGDTIHALLDAIKKQEPRPPRQVDERVPRELDRICLKCLAKRATDRYSTARDLADDLRHWQEGENAPPSTQVKVVVVPAQTSPRPEPERAVPAPVKIVPKGLRSFDAADADFFLELLPGPRDRDGLPESLRFWKTRIEETDADRTFAVGLLYGPSGCGKSSLVKAGLLPRLAAHVTAVYVEATAEETEARLLRGLCKRVPELPPGASLVEALAALRRGRGLPAGQKVLLVLDQFEQWLHARGGADDTLVQALRQCDGARVQAMVLVRDDFWMAATRFLHALEFPLEARNSAAVDLFDLRHARKVLVSFGRAFGALPDAPAELSAEQARFVDQALAGLAQHEKVIPVRLALFAEMMKCRPWTPAALRAVGGATGVGVAFLEETFSAATALPEHRYHQRAARAVLQALLPERGTDIKGQMRSLEALRARADYTTRPRDWQQLLRILDHDLRLVTPTDPEGVEGGEWRVEGEPTTLHPPPAARYYQLTHDYLVPALREWLTRKQRETRRGRAELCLAERSTAWAAKPESRHLPSLAEWARIEMLTPQRDWTPPQRRLMRQATRFHGLRLAIVLTLAALVGWGSWEWIGTMRATERVNALMGADIAEVPKLVEAIGPYRRWAVPRLQAQVAANDKESLHAALALARLQVDADGELAEYFWQALGDPQTGARRQLPAAAALAALDPDSSRWAEHAPAVATALVRENVLQAAKWAEALRPVRKELVKPLLDVFHDTARPEAERGQAADLLADLAEDRPEVLAEVLMEAGAKQFAVVLGKLTAHRQQGVRLLEAELAKESPQEALEPARESLAQRQANAAVALLRMDQAEKVWPLLQHRRDPRVRSYLIHHVGPLGVDARSLVRRLVEQEEPDVTARRALLLCLAEPGPDQLSGAERLALVPKLLALYCDDPDPGLHGAAEWVLRQWGEEKKLDAMAEVLKKRDHKTAKEGVRPPDGRCWYVNGQGQTFALVLDPHEFLMGSPHDEEGRDKRAQGKIETPHRRRIGRSFAVATKEVTVEQFKFLLRSHIYDTDVATTPQHPVNSVSWYDAAEYCNRLSAQEKIPEDQWCYEEYENEGKKGLRMRQNYLHLTGYRLPTEAEWEYACRADAVTRRYFGESDRLLGRYVWYTENSKDRNMLPPGSLRPNDLGLFDMLGNAFEWCQDEGGFYPQGQGGEPAEDKESSADTVEITDKKSRVVRGGSYVHETMSVRSAYRGFAPPERRNKIYGVRPARTIH